MGNEKQSAWPFPIILSKPEIRLVVFGLYRMGWEDKMGVSSTLLPENGYDA